jgi:hypothetical protein
MDKLKIALTILSIAIMLVPIAVELLVYRDNLSGLVLPPQFESLLNGADSNPTSDGTQASQLLPDFQLPQPVGQPKYDQQTGAFVYPFNFTNPLDTEISLDKLTADICSKDNTTLGTISIDQPININPGESAIINAEGILSQDTINQLSAQYSSYANLDIALENVDVTIGGVSIHIDHIDAGSIPELR